MTTTGVVVVTDRGGHLHNALQLLGKMDLEAQAVVTTNGPDIEFLKRSSIPVWTLPYLFSWIGKRRLFNPFVSLAHLARAFWICMQLRPRSVISVGASNVVPFCYFAKLLGAQVIHVECMNQVKTPSVTGRFLYPISTRLFVQWPELLKAYGPKARYEGWVL